MTKIKLSLPSIEDQIEGFRKLVVTDDKVTEQFKNDTKDRQATMLANAYTLAQEWLALDDPTELVRALNTRQIPLPDQSVGENLYRPFVRLLFGQFDPDAKRVDYAGIKGLTKFVRSTSAEKYAGVLRYLADHDTQPDAAKELILGFKGHVNGIIVADRKDHMVKKPVIIESELTERMGRTTSLGEVTLPAGGKISTETFGAAWFVRKGNKLVFYGILPKMADRARAAAVAADEAAGSVHVADKAVAEGVARFREFSIKTLKSKMQPEVA